MIQISQYMDKGNKKTSSFSSVKEEESFFQPYGSNECGIYCIFRAADKQRKGRGENDGGKRD